MGSSVTRYLVDIDYKLKGLDRANKALETTAQKAKASETSFLSLRNLMLGGLALRGFGAMNRALIGSNASLESLKIGMATILASNFHRPFQAAQGAASKLVEDYREIAKASPGTTRDFIEMNNSIMGALTAAGGSIADLKDMTKGAVIGATAFGIRPDMAGLDVTQALMGKVTARDRFAKMLIEPIMATEKFNKLSAERRIRVLKQALTSPAIKAAADEYGKSFDGQLSTFKDTMEQTLQKIGLPLFKKITAELSKWNEWAGKNQDKIEAFAKRMGEMISKAFDALYSFGRWIYNNRDVLLKVAEAFLVMKGAGMVAGSIGGGMQSLSNALNNGVSAVNVFTLAMMGVAGLVWGLKKLFPGSSPFETQEGAERIGDQAAVGAIWHTSAEDEKKIAARKAARDAERARAAQAAKWQEAGQLTQQAKVWTKKASIDDSTKLPPRKSGDMNVTIKKLEVSAKDVDNFIHQIPRVIGKEVRVPSQAARLPRSNW